MTAGRHRHGAAMASAPSSCLIDDEATQVRLAAATATSAAMLRHLADSPSITVRAAVAMNEAAPSEAHRRLAHDDDERIRSLLGRRLASLLPTLSHDGGIGVGQACALLRGLVADEATRVRAAVADVLKDMPDVPRELILRLAHDVDISVHEPIIRLSPILTAADLLALLAAPPSPATVLAVARRPDLNETISDAIAATADNAAIQGLLENPSAAIREATLDALIVQAAGRLGWHEPLVTRACLPPRAALALSGFVADQLLARLADREDLPPDVAAELRRRLDHRLQPTAAILATAGSQADPDAEQAWAVAQAMLTADQLTEAAILAALGIRQTRLASAMLAVLAGVTVGVVDRAASLRSAKGMVSLAWKAGLTMRATVPLQVLLARLAPSAVLPAGPDGAFPLAAEEMHWQLDFLGRMGR